MKPSLRLVVLATFLLAAVALPAAAVGVFADPAGVNNGEVEIAAAADQDLVLHVVKGSTSSGGDVCRMAGGSGDEICAYHLELELEGEGFIQQFTPASSGVKYWPQDFVAQNVRTLRVAFVGAEPAPTSPAPLEIGTLRVDASPGDTRVLAKGHQIVTAALTEEDVPEQTVAATPLPEPGVLLQLGSVLAALALLRRLRGAARA